ncbi:hypothetical protein KCP76_24555 [Salmonella enterica subsp. enterica serovar Weltevreden]|nr:hypothetical protein KCP76_24555 [Salmonella enterica subsp. enterica serovar Weltevreden]
MENLAYHLQRHRGFTRVRQRPLVNDDISSRGPVKINPAGASNGASDCARSTIESPTVGGHFVIDPDEAKH